MVGSQQPYFPAAWSAANSMVGRYGVEAVFVAQREVDAKIRQGDFSAAIEADQVRRTLLDLIIDIEPPAHY